MILKQGQKIVYGGCQLEILVNEPNEQALAIAIVTGNEKVGGAYNHPIQMSPYWAEENKIKCPILDHELGQPLYRALVRLIEEADKEGATRAYVRSLQWLTPTDSRTNPEVVIYAVLYR